MSKIKCAIIGSGNIGTDLMIKVMRLSDVLEMGVMVGIDPASDGLARARRMGVATTHEGIDGLMAMPEFEDVDIVFDATSAAAHKRNSELVLAAGKRMVDLTPAAIGPYVIPPVNGDTFLDAKNVGRPEFAADDGAVFHEGVQCTGNVIPDGLQGRSGNQRFSREVADGRLLTGRDDRVCYRGANAQ